MFKKWGLRLLWRWVFLPQHMHLLAPAPRAPLPVHHETQAAALAVAPRQQVPGPHGAPLGPALPVSLAPPVFAGVPLSLGGASGQWHEGSLLSGQAPLPSPEVDSNALPGAGRPSLARPGDVLLGACAAATALLQPTRDTGGVGTTAGAPDRDVVGEWWRGVGSEEGCGGARRSVGAKE